jgi:peptide deformylase
MEIVLPPLKIVNYPHPSLRHPAVPLKEINARVRRIAEEMLERMYEAKGLGLAGPQVGLPIALFVCNYSADREGRETEGVYINPVITERSGSVEAEEGCLSFPGFYRKVRRAKAITAQAYNLKGELVELKASDLPARIWQHEVEHLEGKLFIDKMSIMGQLTARATLGEFEYEYRRAQKKGEIPPDPEILQALKKLEALAEPMPPEPAAPAPVM